MIHRISQTMNEALLDELEFWEQDRRFVSKQHDI